MYSQPGSSEVIQSSMVVLGLPMYRVRKGRQGGENWQILISHLAHGGDQRAPSQFPTLQRHTRHRQTLHRLDQIPHCKATKSPLRSAAAPNIFRGPATRQKDTERTSQFPFTRRTALAVSMARVSAMAKERVKETALTVTEARLGDTRYHKIVTTKIRTRIASAVWKARPTLAAQQAPPHAKLSGINVSCDGDQVTKHHHDVWLAQAD